MLQDLRKIFIIKVLDFAFLIRDTFLQSSSKFFQLSQIGHVKGSFITFDQIIVSMVQLHFRQNFSMRGSSYELSLVIAGFLTSKPPITGKG